MRTGLHCGGCIIVDEPKPMRVTQALKRPEFPANEAHGFVSRIEEERMASVPNGDRKPTALTRLRRESLWWRELEGGEVDRVSGSQR